MLRITILLALSPSRTHPGKNHSLLTTRTRIAVVPHAEPLVFSPLREVTGKNTEIVCRGLYLVNGKVSEMERYPSATCLKKAR